jgi:hypothetical protein
MSSAYFPPPALPQELKTSKLKIDALLKLSRCKGVGERQLRIRHDTSNRLIEALGFRLFLNQRHTIKDLRAAAMPKQQRGAVCRGQSTEHERE